MLINTQLADFLELLNLDYYDDNGRLRIIDLENNTSTYVEKDDKDKSRFTIGNLTCIFDKYSFEITIDDKKITVSRNRFLYERKVNNQDTIGTAFSMKNNTITFQYNNDDMNSTISLKYDNNYNYHGMKKTEHIKDIKGTSFGFFTFFEKENIAFVKSTYYLFDHNGRKKPSITDIEQLYDSLDGLITKEIRTNHIIPCVLSEIEEMIPGIIEYYCNLNPNIKEIYNNVKKIYN